MADTIKPSNAAMMDLHNMDVDRMHEEHARTGVYIDPVTRKRLPEGTVLIKNPNRDQRRALARWRKGVK